MKFFNVVAGLYKVLVKYPAIAAGLANIVVVAAATFGFHLTSDQVVTAVSFTAAVTAVLVHAGVTPLHEAKKGNVPEKVKQAVKKSD